MSSHLSSTTNRKDQPAILGPHGKELTSLAFARSAGEWLRRARRRRPRKRLGILSGRWSAAKRRNRTACASARATPGLRYRARSPLAKCSPLRCNSCPLARRGPRANSPLPSILPLCAPGWSPSLPADAPALRRKPARPYRKVLPRAVRELPRHARPRPAPFERSRPNCADLPLRRVIRSIPFARGLRWQSPECLLESPPHAPPPTPPLPDGLSNWLAGRAARGLRTSPERPACAPVARFLQPACPASPWQWRCDR